MRYKRLAELALQLAWDRKANAEAVENPQRDPTLRGIGRLRDNPRRSEYLFGKQPNDNYAIVPTR
jgi:hypothetical protein